MNTVIEQMLRKYDSKNIYDQKNAMKEVMQEIVLYGLREAQAFYVDEYGYRQVDYLLPELENMKQAEPEPYER